MRYKKLLLLNAAYEDNYFDLQPEIPVGLGYIAEALKNEGIEYDVMDMDLGYRIGDLEEKVLSFKPELIGMSLMSLGYQKNYEIIKKIKRKFPSIDLVVGGPHVSTMKEKVLKECEEIDLGVVREGELTMLELCKGKDLMNIKGLMFRKNSEIINTGDCELVLDLDNLKFPRFERFEPEKYKNIHKDKKQRIPISTSRGCPFSCTYCGAYLSIGKKFRYRSATNVVDEIEYWHEKGQKDFRIVDDNFTLKKERVYEICDEIERRKLQALRLSCDNGVRADRVDKDLLMRMKEVGFYRLDFGVEGGNDKILKNLKKGEKIETIKQAVREACETGFEVELTFLIGSPGETWSDFKDGVNLALKYPITSAIWYHILPYPGTELYNWLKEKDYLLEEPRYYLNSVSRRKNHPLFITPELSLEDRKKAWNYSQKVIRKITIRATKRKLRKLGIFGKIFAYLYGSFLLRNLFIGSKIVRKFVVNPVKRLAKLHM